MSSALKKLGLEPFESDTTFYIWTKVPEGYTSSEFVGRLIDEAGIVCTPGNGFGDAGEGYFRISLTVPTERLVEAAKRIENLKL
jgi:LL-diaminopimelate aminotransferase